MRDRAQSIFENRARMIAGIVFLVAVFAILVTSVQGYRLGRPLLGTDFAAFWSAARLAQTVGPVAPFDAALIGELQQQALGKDGILLWHYPATYLVAVWPFGALPYLPALVVFSGLSIAAWVLAVKLVWPHTSAWRLLPVLSAPAVWMNLVQGQNGAFVALLLVGFLISLRANRVWPAALCAAALLIKPHFGVLMPVVLILSLNWRVLGAATLLSAAFLALATWIFGIAYWVAFVDNAGRLSGALLDGGLLHEQISGFAFVRGLGGSASVAYAVQLVSAGFAILVAVVSWRTTNWNLKMAGFLLASVSLSPYAFQYDLVAGVIATGLLYQQARGRGYRLANGILTLFWVAPFANQYVYSQTGVLVLYPLLIAMLALCLVLARQTSPEPTPETAV